VQCRLKFSGIDGSPQAADFFAPALDNGHMIQYNSGGGWAAGQKNTVFRWEGEFNVEYI
jgi:hypothetical protein